MGRFRHILATAALAGTIIALAGVQQAHAAGTPAPGYAVSDFATGFTNNGSIGPIGVAFDSSNNLYVGDYDTGIVYKFGSGGGVASSATQLNTTPICCSIAGLAFSKSGRLYLALQGSSQVVEIDPSTAAVLRVVASVPCATGLATDPLSGDLFVTEVGCGSAIVRISNPDSATPTQSNYAFPGGTDGITFGPDGSIYTETNGCADKISGTNQPAPPTITLLACVSSMDGIAVAANASDPSAPPFIFTNDNDGTITKVDLTTSPPTLTQIVTAGTRGDFVAVGPDGCLYATQTATVEKVTNADGSCNLSSTGGNPQLSLAPLVVGPQQVGTTATLTATLKNVTSPAGTVVTFTITGANPQVLTSVADASGNAVLSYTGVISGVDTVVASSQVGPTPLVSNPATVTWTKPSDTTPPSCVLKKVIVGPPKRLVIAVQDSDGGLAGPPGGIVVTAATNATVHIPTYSAGDTGEIDVVATKINQSLASEVALRVTDAAGNVTTCDPVMTDVVRDEGGPDVVFVGHVTQSEGFVHIANGTPGVTRLTLWVNGTRFPVRGLRPGAQSTVDISSALRPGFNAVLVAALGHRQGDATIVFADS